MKNPLNSWIQIVYTVVWYTFMLQYYEVTECRMLISNQNHFWSEPELSWCFKSCFLTRCQLSWKCHQNPFRSCPVILLPNIKNRQTNKGHRASSLGRGKNRDSIWLQISFDVDNQIHAPWLHSWFLCHLTSNELTCTRNVNIQFCL